MNFIRRTIYLGYYLKKMNWPLLGKFIQYTQEKTGRSKLSICMDAVRSVYVYNVSVLEYFQFRFFEKANDERLKWAGMGFMYESINRLNPRKNRFILSDKRKFFQHYKDYVGRNHITLEELKSTKSNPPKWLMEENNKLVLKSSFGQCGSGIEILSVRQFTLDEIYSRAKQAGNDLIEEYVEQHEDLKKLSPHGLNTLRIITQINNKGEVDILGVRLRISVNSVVDNMAAGNLAAEVDEKSGIVVGPGVYSDITKLDCSKHPITNEDIIGFKIPYFEEAMRKAKDAALFDKTNTSIGWDIGITNEGPVIIEGNHDWCKLLWQLPVHQGLKHILIKYVQEVR